MSNSVIGVYHNAQGRRSPLEHPKVARHFFTDLDPHFSLEFQTGLSNFILPEMHRQCNRSSFQYPDQTCDQWCHNKHKKERCPTRYDALALAQKRGLSRVVSMITDIQKGVRKQGDGLPTLNGPQNAGKKAQCGSTKMSPGVKMQLVF